MMIAGDWPVPWAGARPPAGACDAASPRDANPASTGRANTADAASAARHDAAGLPDRPRVHARSASRGGTLAATVRSSS